MKAASPPTTSPPTTSQTDSPSAPNSQALETLRRQHQLILNAVGEGVYGLDL
ncbi:MAG: PAS domain-containing sensor histidine kinase, partial [Cyanobacteria bacterium J06554_11]